MPTAAQIDSFIVPAVKITAGAVVLYGLYRVGQKFHIFDSDESKATDAATQNAAGSSTIVDKNNPLLAFNPNYRTALIKQYGKLTHKVFPVRSQLGNYSIDQLKSIAIDIYKSKGVFVDNEKKVFSVFRKIQTQYQLSFISGVFSTTYKADLLLYLKSFLSDEELSNIIQMVNNYPQYLP